MARGTPAYDALKAERAAPLYAAIERFIPDVRERVEVELIGSPLTHERFLRRHRGTYGPELSAADSTFPGAKTQVDAPQAPPAHHPPSPVPRPWPLAPTLAQPSPPGLSCPRPNPNRSTGCSAAATRAGRASACPPSPAQASPPLTWSPGRWRSASCCARCGGGARCCPRSEAYAAISAICIWCGGLAVGGRVFQFEPTQCGTGSTRHPGEKYQVR